jgi:hypothetical protein
MTPPRLPRRSAAVAGAAALALATLGVAGPAAADARAIDDACTGNTADAGFTDIGYLPAANEDAINCLVAYDVTEGYTPTQYGPDRPVQRWQMALFLHRELLHLATANEAIELPEPAPTTFTDLAGYSEEVQAAVATLVAAEVTTGKTTTSFAPGDMVTRLDMASFVNRLQNYVADQLADPAAAYDAADSTAEFDDLTTTVPRRDDVYALEGVGIVQGTGAATYDPYGAVSRAQMAFFITRHLDENIEAGRSLAVGQDVVWNTSQVVSYDDLGDAVAASVAGDRLVAMGEFTETERIVLDDDDVVLTGRGETVVNGSFEVNGADGVALDGMVVQDYVTAGGVTAGVYLVDATGVQVSDNAFLGGTEDAAAHRGVENATGGDAEQASIVGNVFYFHVTGVFANPGAEYTVEANVFQSNTVGSANDAASVVRGNVFDGNAEAVGLGAEGSTVVDNLFGVNDVHVADYTKAYDLVTVEAANVFDTDVEVVEGELANTIVDME